MSDPKFFALIIGTEILNRRRRDAHFDFVTQTLAAKGYKLTGSFIIEDDPELIVQTIRFIASQEHAVLFSFGGIGSTPDDYTRKCAAIALRDGEIETHEEAKKIIVNKLGQKAFPHSVKMAQLPQGSNLLHNPVNGMPAFSLDNRYYFMPGFPEMSHPMVETILQDMIPKAKKTYRYTLTAHTKESIFIEIMEKMPKGVEFSSLPKLYSDGWRVTISVASEDDVLAKEAFDRYVTLLKERNIVYGLNEGD